jgi:hypothetical protein
LIHLHEQTASREASACKGVLVVVHSALTLGMTGANFIGSGFIGAERVFVTVVGGLMLVLIGAADAEGDVLAGVDAEIRECVLRQHGRVVEEEQLRLGVGVKAKLMQDGKGELGDLVVDADLKCV